MANIMISISFMVLYISFLVVVGGGEAIDVLVPDVFQDKDSPFETEEDGGFFDSLSAIADILVGLLQLAWGFVVLAFSVITVDLSTFGIPTPGALPRMLMAIPVNLATMHIFWNIVLLIRGAT